MPLVFTSNDPDDQGRLPITLIHQQPKLLPADRRKQGVDVDPEQLVKPAMQPGQKARPWLTETGNVEWDIIDPQEDDEAVVRKRLADAEARIEALVSVAESKSLLTRTEVDDEVTRTRTVEDEPTRTR